MIAAFSQDEVSNASEPLYEYLDQQVESIAPDAIPSVSCGIRSGLDAVAFQIAQNIEQAAKMTLEGAMQIGQMLLSLKTDLKRLEYKIFLSQIGWTPSAANKYIRLAKTFQDFEVLRLGRVELTTLLSLCTKTYAGVVERCRDIGDVTQELVERLKKESRPPRKSAQQPDLVTGWKQDHSGGGRHYSINLFDEKTGISIEKQASYDGILPHRVIEDAIALREQRNNCVTQARVH